MTKKETKEISANKRKYAKVFKKPSLTKRSFKNECDVNQVMARFEKTGVIDHVNQRRPVYTDVSNFEDYQTSIGIVLSAHRQFEQLPSKIRARFENDPGEFLKFIENPENKQEAIEIGLIEAPKNPEVKPPKSEEPPEPEPDEKAE